MNEQDPLAQLRDIHMPDPQGWWPPAPGWWLLGALLLAGLFCALWLLYRQHQRQAYRRAARAELEAARSRWQVSGNGAVYLDAVSRLLRRVARQAWPDYPLNHLQGEAWLAFLDQGLAADGADSFSRGAGRALITDLYRPEGPSAEQLSALHELTGRWITEHRAQQGQPASPAAEASRAGI